MYQQPINPYAPNSYQQQKEQLMQMMYPNVPQQSIHAPRVNGAAGAEAYNMPPDSDTLVLDNTAPIIWFLQTDSAGLKIKIPYDISEHVEKKPEDVYKSLENRIKKLEDRLNGNKSYNPNANKSKPEQRNDAGVPGNDAR